MSEPLSQSPPSQAAEPPRRKLNRRFLLGAVLGVLLGASTVILLYIVQLGGVRITYTWSICAANVHGIGKAIAMYHAENEDLPPLSPQNLVGVGFSWKMFVCRSAIHELGDIEDYPIKDSDYVLIPLEGNAPETVAAVFELPANHRQKRYNFCRANSSIESLETPLEFLPAVQQANDYHARMREKP